MFPIETTRHSCAHVMAAAIAQLWPAAMFGVGPTISNGFYYDVLFPTPISQEDLGNIERVMKRIKRNKRRFVREDILIDDAAALFKDRAQDFKLELISLLRDKGSTSVAAELEDINVVSRRDQTVAEVTTYHVEGFIDLCRGPHVDNTGQIGSFALTRIAGAYWRGNEKNPQLQRIYGLCFNTEAELAAEHQRLEQVKLRDHRRIGKHMEIFHISQEVGSGLPLWLPNGTALRDELEFLAKQEERRAGYQRVSTPHITNEALYYQSGHLPYYKDDMYAPIEIEKVNYYLRPMNCPHHHHIYLSKPRSYRALPVRLAEYGQVYRYEASGSLSGIMRTRGFCQNDAHIYCRADQAKDEFTQVMTMHAKYYRLFGISDFHMRLSLPDLSNIHKYVDKPADWLAALEIIRAAMADSGLPYVEAKGEAAFYGPKIDFIIKSAIGTEYAISTNQLDFLASERFGLRYTGDDGAEHPLYVIHRAPLGSHERFVAFLIEHYGGKFPLWLSPVQAIVLSISERSNDYAEAVFNQIKSLEVNNGSLGLRVEADLSSERVQKKIRDAAMRHIPVMAIVGENEERDGTVAVRGQQGTDFGQVELDTFLNSLKDASEQRDDAALMFECRSDIS